MQEHRTWSPELTLVVIEDQDPGWSWSSHVIHKVPQELWAPFQYKGNLIRYGDSVYGDKMVMTLENMAKIDLKQTTKITNYHQVSNKTPTLLGNEIVDHSDVVGASPVGAAPTTSSFST